MKSNTPVFLIIAVLSSGCLSFEPLTQPPEADAGGDTGTGEETPEWNSCEGFVGTDFLIVMDNSSTMGEEQYLLSTEVYMMVNEFSRSLLLTGDTPLAELEELRVALVSTDLGLQYGDSGAVEDGSIGSCEGKGDDGRFRTDVPASITVESGRIDCEPDAGIGCPEAWRCEDGKCSAPGDAGDDEIPCEPLAHDSLDYTRDDISLIANNIACMGRMGTDGCGIEQQFQAGLRALTREDQRAFLADDHRLVILIVTDEEDCSIRDPGLFETPEWRDHKQRNTACHYPEKNSRDYLFDPSHLLEKMAELKGGTGGVAFVAMVGVPMNERCQGFGDEIGDCLSDPAMAYEIEPRPAPEYQRLRPACTREKDGIVITEAAPARRFAEAVQSFGEAGYLYSVCNDTWDGVITELSYLIGLCYPLS